MSKQFEFEKVKGWGGKRAGAGRKNRSGLKGHVKREKIDLKKPMHITLKFKRNGLLRKKSTLKQFRSAVKEAKKFCLYVLHYSLQHDHIHMIVEAKNNECLERGMKSLCGRLGKMIRATIGGAGPVFKGRYFPQVIANPTQMRNALAYVLTNSMKHLKIAATGVDAYSSGFAFKDWKRLLRKNYSTFIEEQIRAFAAELDELSMPQSWLASVGWYKAR